MRKEIIWENGNTIALSEIENVETTLKVKFPNFFVDFILNNNYSQPSLSLFDTTSSKGCVLGRLLSFSKKDKRNVLNTVSALSEEIPKNVIPIGVDPGGNYICFDFRDLEIPEIVYWNHELDFEFNENLIIPKNQNQIEFISSNFEDFLDKLYE